MVLSAGVRAMKQLLSGADATTVTYEQLHLRYLELVAAHSMLRAAAPCSVPPHGTCSQCVDRAVRKGMGIQVLCPVVQAQIKRLPVRQKPCKPGLAGYSESDQFAAALGSLSVHPPS